MSDQTVICGFWSGETLSDKLPELIKPFEASNVDCAAYTLTIGHEVYVSPSDQTPDPQSITKRILNDGEAFTVPPGQFAFLITQEIVRVPNDALGLISMKARIKFRGLVNISGFHVDPGYEGPLTYSVFNAGPVAVQLQQGEPCFLIWYASLDRRSSYVKSIPARKGLDIELINNISGEVHSLKGLDNKIRVVEKLLGERINKIEVAQASFSAVMSVWVPVVTGVVAAIVGGVIVWTVTSAFTPKPVSQSATQTSAISTLPGKAGATTTAVPSAIPSRAKIPRS